ncbi:MAG: HNH endonuclease [Lachnospiraceae bacterium]|nr:HNH endonuclease [Lachnospiraceae bacterium]
MRVVYVLNRKGNPLMPTTRFGHIRRLLKSKQAVAVNNNPFTIRLKYETPDIIQPLTLGIDPGRENIGLAVSNGSNTSLFTAKVQTNNKSVTQNMTDRKQFRQARRRHHRQKKQRKALRNNTQLKNGTPNTLRNKKLCHSINISYPGMEKHITHKVIKGKEAKFNNRKRPEGWLTPSARNLIQIHTNLVKMIQSLLPISRIIIENNSFDFQKLENQNIQAWQYQKGNLYGFKSYKDYINQQQNNLCLLCKSRSINQYHHIVPRSKNGSNTIANIAGLCSTCHQRVHTEEFYNNRLLKLKQGLKKQYSVCLLNIALPYIIESLQQLLPITLTTGYQTSELRQKYNLPKDHHIDAYLISISGNTQENIDQSTTKVRPYQIKHFKKKSANNIKKYGSRKYFYKGKLVATNRHKALEQKEDSLEEFLNKNSSSPQEKQRLISQLKVQPAKRIYNIHKSRQIPQFKCGDKIIRNKRKKIDGYKQKKYNKEVYITSKINNATKSLITDYGNFNFKYCKLLESRSLAFI